MLICRFTRENDLFAVVLGLLLAARVGNGSPPGKCDYGVAAEASRRFAYDLYFAVARGEPRNIFLAPTTVATALTMIHAGADGNTRVQLSRGLKLYDTSRRLSEGDLPCMFEVTHSADNDDPVADPKVNDIVFKTAARMYGEKTFRFRRAFINRTRELGQRMKRLSFVSQPTDSRNRINHWVSKMTNEKIPRLFGKDDISSDTVLAIVAVVYFKAPWKTTFSKMSPDIFTTSDHREVMSKYMNARGRFRRSTSGEQGLLAEMIELPYQENEDVSASMIILLPTTTMSDVEERLTEQTTQREIETLLQSSPRSCNVVMPKFEISAEYDLRPILTYMGMGDMFQTNRADLTRMAALSSKPLYVSNAVQKTYVKVNENGTEAAGATGLSITTRSFHTPLLINKAFLTIIYEKNTNTILFIGKVNDPSRTDGDV